jgi:cell division protein FtsA
VLDEQHLHPSSFNLQPANIEVSVQQEFISAIDIGTTKICALTAALTNDSMGNPALRVLGQGQSVSAGIRRGVVVNVSEAIGCIGEAVEKCEADAGQHMLSAYIGIAGSHIGALNSRGVSPVDAGSGVTNHDMDRALDGARAVALPENQSVIHTLPRHWVVDGESHIQHPLGMSAIRLEVDAHIVTGSSTAIKNLTQCVLSHNIDVDDLVLEPLAAGKAVLRPEERRMGVAVVDMGGGTSDIAVFIDDGLCHTEILDIGGNHFTRDVAMGIHAPFETAEELKLRYGSVFPERIAEDERVWASVFGEKSERNFSRQFICDILAERAAETFEIVARQLEESGYIDSLPAGVVLTGGSSQLHGLAEMGRSILGMPVRTGAPTNNLPILNINRQLQNPIFATSMGLLLWGMEEGGRLARERFPANADSPHSPWITQLIQWLRNLLPG